MNAQKPNGTGSSVLPPVEQEAPGLPGGGDGNPPAPMPPGRLPSGGPKRPPEREDETWQPDTFMAALRLSAPLVPIVAALITVSLYVAVGEAVKDVWVAAITVLGGIAITVLLWLLVGLLWKPGLTVSKARPTLYGDLRRRLVRLEAQESTLCPRGVPADPSAYSDPTAREAAESVHQRIKVIKDQLEGKAHDLPDEDLLWIRGTGYAGLYELVESVGEDLIELEPIPDLCADGLHHRLRLEGSNLDKLRVKELTAKIDSAVGALEDLGKPWLDRLAGALYDQIKANDGKVSTETVQKALKTLEELDPRFIESLAPPILIQIQEHNAIASAEAVRDALKSNPALLDKIGERIDDKTRASKESLARSVIHSVSQVVHGYQAEHYQGLVRARERLTRSVMWMGAAGFAILALAIIDLASTSSILAMSFFFMVGAAVGLFNRVRTDAETNVVLEEDYGWSEIQLIHTALFSGLAALGGVLVVALLPAFIGSLGVPQNSLQPKVPQLVEIFALGTNTLGLVVAAIFGLTPTLFTSALQKQVAKIKSDLISLKPHEESAGGD